MTDPTFIDCQKEYLEILTLTRQFLGQECSPNELIVSQPDSYAYFKKIAQPSKKVESHVTQTPHLSTQPCPLPEKKIVPPPQTQPKASEKRDKLTESSAPPSKDKKEPENLSKSISPTKTGFQLEKLGQPTELDVKEFATHMQSNFPNYPIRSTIPRPKIESKAMNPTKSSVPPVVILSFYQDEESQAFLKNVAQAIQNKFLSATVFPALRIEQEKKWEALLQSPSLRLIIVPTYRIHELPLLQGYYNAELNRIHTTPIIPISDPMEYLKSSSLKSQLWQAITQALKPS